MGITRLWPIIHKSDLMHLLDADAIPHINIDFLGCFFPVLIRNQSLRSKIYFIGSLLEHFKENSTIFIDGRPTIEKAETSAKRSENRSKRISKGLRLLNCHRLSAARVRKVKSILKSSYRISIEEKEEIANLLSDLGFDVMLCEGEADVTIHRLPGTENVVMSRDSDYLLMENVS